MLWTHKNTFEICFFLQNILKDGCKPEIDEIKVAENAEEHKAKEYANALEGMQHALKREQQIKMEQVIHEKNKANVCHQHDRSCQICFAVNSFVVYFQDGKKGFINQLQSQLQRSEFIGTNDDQNVPESWKFENQSNVNVKKERKGKNKNNKKKNDKKNAKKVEQTE